jgi:RimJ/RimL family protein N-acetyltransferase
MSIKMINIRSSISSERLYLTELNSAAHAFILELVNSPGWLTFIGNRNVTTTAAAIAYIDMINQNPDIQYWTVRLKASETPIGIITLIKRAYLEQYDIGFAFLEQYSGQGYAEEATRALLYQLPECLLKNKILAITTAANERSVRLLEKLNFQYETTIEADGRSLLQYALSADQLQIDQVTQAFFNTFTNKTTVPQFNMIEELCTGQVQIIKKTAEGADLYSLASFIEPRKKILTDGTLTGFREYETRGETRITGNIAQRYSRYQKSGTMNGKPFTGSGHKFFHLMKEHGKWKIAQVIWEDDA